MAVSSRAFAVSIVLACAGSAMLLHAAAQQATCTSLPLVLPLPGGPVAFSEQQEADLGDAIAEHILQSYRVVDDDSNDYLQRLGERILKQLPPTALRFRFSLIDVPDVNAYALPGGRVLVTRKMVAFAQSEDELAGVVAHEIGHIITRQLAATLTRQFRDSLKITTFTDRADIFEKYHRLVDHPGAVPDAREEDEQYDADAVALEAAARAGYSPEAYINLWDRYTEAGNKTGNFFTDFFGTTKPEGRRLRQMVKTIATVPPQCRASVASTAQSTFAAWRSRVVENGGARNSVALRGLFDEHALEPALNAAIQWLRFSPDGNYVLAQDEASITVLTREPFTPVLQIEAEDAMAAQFTPDSRALVFATHSLRVERWDLEKRARTDVHEMVLRHDCLGGALSPDGRLLACLEPIEDTGLGSLKTELTLFDVATGDVRFKQTRAYPWPSDREALSSLRRRGDLAFRFAFSPDGRYFVLGQSDGGTVIDVASRAEASLPAEMRRAFRASFAFIGADRVVTVDAQRPDQSALLRFPSGERIKPLTLSGKVTAATRGDYLLVRPAQHWAVGIVDIAQNKVVGVSNASALDIYDTLRVNEQLNGDLALYGSDAQHPVAVASLPRALLGDMAGASLSPNLKWISLSVPGRGGVWSLETGRRALLVRGFTSSGIADDGTLYADFSRDSHVSNARLVEFPRTLTEVSTNAEAKELAPLEDIAARVSSRFLMVMTPQRPGAYDRRTTLVVEDVATQMKLWTREFPNETPQQFTDTLHRRLIFEWPVASDAARAVLSADGRLRSAAQAQGLKGEDVLLEIQDLATGTIVGRLVVPTGRSFRKIRAAVSDGDELVLADALNQVTSYSISTGRRVGSVFGQLPTLSLKAGLLCVQNEPGHLVFHDPQSLARLSELTLPRPVRIAAFSEDGSRLLAITSDQIARVFDVSTLRGNNGGVPLRSGRRTNL